MQKLPVLTRKSHSIGFAFRNSARDFGHNSPADSARELIDVPEDAESLVPSNKNWLLSDLYLWGTV